MTKRAAGFVAAVLLTVLGSGILLAYVRSAEDRALEGETVTEVFVVAQDIARGTKGEEIANRIRTERVPAKVRVEDAVTSLDEIEGLVTVLDLRPGEQVTRSRFVLAQSLSGFEGPSLNIPDSHVQVSVAVDPQRAVGGTIVPGDLVSIFASFDPFSVAAPELPDGSTPILEIDGTLVSAGDETPNTTHIILHNVLVTNVQIERDASSSSFGGNDDDDDQVGLAPAPVRNLLVTVALEPGDAERIVFTAEHGSLWFAAEGSAVTAEGNFVRTRGTIYSLVQPDVVQSLPQATTEAVSTDDEGGQ